MKPPAGAKLILRFTGFPRVAIHLTEEARVAAEKEYADVTEAALGELKQELRSMGINAPEGTSGVIEYQGVKLALDYAPAAQKLAIRIIQKPPFVPENLIWQLLDARLNKARGL